MHHLRMKIFILIFALQKGFFAYGLTCFKCASDFKCIFEAGTASECDKNYCTIYRQEYLDPPGKVIHFYRSCEDKPAYLNAVIQTANHKTYYRACPDNLCNIGDGIEAVASDLQAGRKTTKRIYQVPGIGSTATTNLALIVELVFSLVIFVVLLR